MSTIAPATSGAVLAGFDYLSCSALDVAYSWPDSVFLDPNSPQDCALYCTDRGYSYFTIQAQWCGCDNVLPPLVQNYTDAGHADCSFDCNNECFAGEFCGGFDPNSFAPLFNVYGPGTGVGNPGGVGAAGACSASSASAPTDVATATTTMMTSVSAAATTTTADAVTTSAATSSAADGGASVGAGAGSDTSSASGSASMTSDASGIAAGTETTAAGATSGSDATATSVDDPSATSTNVPMITRTVVSTVTDTITSCAATKTHCPGAGAASAHPIIVVHTTSYPASAYVCPEHGTTVYYDPSESALTTQQRYVTVTVEGGRVTRTVTRYATLVPVSTQAPALPAPIVKPGGNGTVISPPIVAGASRFDALGVAAAAAAGVGVVWAWV